MGRQIEEQEKQRYAESATEVELDEQHRQFKIIIDLKRRLDRFLCARLPGMSRSRLQKLINEGCVRVNGQDPKNSTVLREGDLVDVEIPPPRFQQIEAEEIPLEVIYEDEHLIAINKQSNLVVHPARSNLSGTLVNGLAWHFKDIKPNGLEALSSIGIDEFRPGIVHRLDKDTTGVIVVAKTDEAHTRLQRQWEARNVQKYYVAVVHGEMTPPGGVIDLPIGKHLHVPEAYAVRHDEHGRPSVTIYRVREVYQGYTLVELEIKTGRTHQIRVHLQNLGYPIVTDVVYGGEMVGTGEIAEPPTAAGATPDLSFARKKEDGLKMWDVVETREDLIMRRPALHAARLEFTHPITEVPVKLTAPFKEDMRNLITTLRENRAKSGPLSAEGACVDLEFAMCGGGDST